MTSEISTSTRASSSGRSMSHFPSRADDLSCLDDDTSLEDALTALAKPRLRLDAIIVEASGFAEPLTLARMLTRMGHHRFHLGGVIDVVDATMHAATVDTETAPPMRYAATTAIRN